MRIIGLVGLGIVCFLAAVLVPVIATGNFSKEGLAKLSGRGAPEAIVEEEAPDDVTPLVRALRQREDGLAKREAKLKEDEERLKMMQADLDKLRAELKTVQAQITQALQAADVDKKARLEEVAKSLAEMKPQNAADTLKEWPPEDAANVLRLVKDKERGKILDSMDPEKAAIVLRAIQERVL